MKCKAIFVILVIFSLLCVFNGSDAAVTADQAAKLKTTLTPMGAEKAGNAEGTIPAWDGGYTTVPPGYKSGDPRPDPFAGEKPLFSITAQNMDKYADRLSDGVKALLQNKKGFRLDVYPTHRPAAAPAYVYENTFINATRAKTTQNGLSIEGAYGGIPFPIAKDGFEAMWNHLLSWSGEAYDSHFRTFTLTADGNRVLNSEVDLNLQWPYYFKDGSLEKTNGDYWYVMNVTVAPPFKAGETIMFRDPVDQYGKGRQAWQYLVGQRRVRRAPAIAYDTPNNVTSGQTNYDEIYMFAGALDRYNWKLIGKKEMYIPYDGNKLYQGTAEQTLTNGMVNPDWMRWELHRVWVIDATLAPGKRHTVPHRIFYLDEDTWKAHLEDGWDGRGTLWRVIMGINVIMPEYPCVTNSGFATYDLLGKTMVFDSYFGESTKVNKMVPPRPDSYFSPDGLAAMGVR